MNIEQTIFDCQQKNIFSSPRILAQMLLISLGRLLWAEARRIGIEICKINVSNPRPCSRWRG